MVMGEVPDAVDVVVIGGGPGGYEAALHAAQLGRQVTLIERGRVGGVCLNVGCIPSKILIETATRRQLYRDIAGASAPPAEDLQRWQGHKQAIVDRLNGGVAAQLKSAGVDVLAGQARLTGRNRVAVALAAGHTRFMEFRHAILATGSRPVTLPCLPADDPRVLDSTAALALTALPQRLVVVGGGYIGIELATAFAKLGTAVSVVEMQARVLPEMPASVAAPLAKRLRELGIEVYLNTAVEGLDAEGLRCRRGDTVQHLPCDRVLVAVGRRPNSDDIGLESAMIQADKNGRIAVGPNRIVAGTAIAAIGDLTAGPMLAHKASAEAAVAARAICGQRVAFEPAAIPLVVFSDPEIACAGATEESAAADGIATRAVTVPLSASGRAATLGTALGFTRLLVDTERDAVIGVQLVGPHASELIAAAVVAIEMAASPADLAATVWAHPTLSEGLHEAARRYLERQ